MPQPTQNKTQLPVAPDAAALSNRISMAIAGRFSNLKNMNPGSQAPTSRRQHRQVAEDDEEDMRRGARLNEGIGYVAEADASKTKTDIAKEDRILRNRLLGKRRAGGAGVSARDGSESDEDVGRSALGKRKRPRRVQAVVDQDTSTGATPEGSDIAEDKPVDGEPPNGATQDKAPSPDAPMTTGDSDTAAAVVNTVTTDAGQSRKKKKKPKKKKNNLGGVADEAPAP